MPLNTAWLYGTHIVNAIMYSSGNVENAVIS